MKSLLREPLIQFLLLGAALFFLEARLRPAAPVTAKSSEIVVSEARVRNLAQNFARTWRRPPTREELGGLVESFIREEVMVREALALGLDRDDAIIRRRLQQKVEFVSEEAAALARPTDEQLKQFLAAHPEAFREEPRVSFAQIYVDPGADAGRAEAEAKRLLERLNRSDTGRDVRQLGDRLLLVEPRYDDIPQSEVARIFGAEFSDSLMTQPVGRWAGPIRSGYGIHLVKVEASRPGSTPELESVRSLVEREWANTQRQELARAYYASLRSKYAITVRMPEAARP